MDVKFPIDNYVRWLEASDDDARARLAAAFRRDVRNRVKELTERTYIDPASTVDYLLLFVPNESVYGFLHEHDADLIDFALARKVVLCSPTTLFAVLAVIRHSADTFLVERRSEEILVALGELRVQWERWTDPLDKMRRGLDSAQRAYDDLIGPRRRAFERHLEDLEALRDGRDHLERGSPGGGAADEDAGMDRGVHPGLNTGNDGPAEVEQRGSSLKLA
jgi:DNA recombination protein RmuC